MSTLVDERIWGAVGWCHLLLDEGVEMDVGVQLYPRHSKNPPNDDDLTSAACALRRTLRSFGYHSLKITGRNAPKLVMMEKAVKTIAEARRERRRIDRLIFGAA